VARSRIFHVAGSPINQRNGRKFHHHRHVPCSIQHDRGAWVVRIRRGKSSLSAGHFLHARLRAPRAGSVFVQATSNAGFRWAHRAPDADFRAGAGRPIGQGCRPASSARSIKPRCDEPQPRQGGRSRRFSRGCARWRADNTNPRKVRPEASISALLLRDQHQIFPSSGVNGREQPDVFLERCAQQNLFASFGNPEIRFSRLEACWMARGPSRKCIIRIAPNGRL